MATRSRPKYWLNEVSFRSVRKIFGRKDTDLIPPICNDSEAIRVLNGLKLLSRSNRCVAGWRGLDGKRSSTDLDLARLCCFCNKSLEKTQKTNFYSDSFWLNTQHPFIPLRNFFKTSLLFLISPKYWHFVPQTQSNWSTRKNQHNFRHKNYSCQELDTVNTVCYISR